MSALLNSGWSGPNGLKSLSSCRSENLKLFCAENNHFIIEFFDEDRYREIINICPKLNFCLTNSLEKIRDNYNRHGKHQHH